jgi:hypothetical protein
MAQQTHPHNMFKIILPPHTNQSVQITVQQTLPGPVVRSIFFPLHFSMLTEKAHQALEICIGPPTYNTGRVSHPPDNIEIHETAEPESNDEVEIVGFRSAPASGASGSKPGITHDDSDDEVEIVGFRLAPASGASGSNPGIAHDDGDIVIIKTKSESSKEFKSDSKSDEDMFVVHFRELPPLTLSLITNRERSWTRRQLVSKT